MTAISSSTVARACPPPPWSALRHLAPEVLDDLTDLWARLDSMAASTVPVTARRGAELRWLVEHLGDLIERALTELAEAKPDGRTTGLGHESAEAVAE